MTSTWSHYLILHLLWMVNERVTWRLLSILTLTWTVTVTEAHLTVFLLMTVILIWICLEILMLVTHRFEQTSCHLHCHSWERTLYLLPYCVTFHYQCHSLLPCPVQLHLKRLPMFIHRAGLHSVIHIQAIHNTKECYPFQIWLFTPGKSADTNQDTQESNVTF